MSEPMMITCEDAMRHLAELLDGELSPDRRHEVDGHLAHCRSCFSRAEFERRLKTELGKLRQEPVPPTFEDRIRVLLAQFPKDS